MAARFKTLSADESKRLLDVRAPGELSVLDVRQPWEYEEFHLPGARLIPLPELSDKLAELDPRKPVLVYCAHGRRSAAAAGLLVGQGFENVMSMEGGIAAWREGYAVGEPRMGMEQFTGVETPLEALSVAYAMEENLGRFYAGLAERAVEEDLRKLCHRLSQFEESHKALVFNIARNHDPDLADPAELLALRASETLEGGFPAELFLAEHQGELTTAHGVVQAAMMFEAQALDLYLRLHRAAGSEHTARAFESLAREERRHLRSLGKLMDRMGERKPASA